MRGTNRHVSRGLAAGHKDTRSVQTHKSWALSGVTLGLIILAMNYASSNENRKATVRPPMGCRDGVADTGP